mmetsp:Transcript_19313/g.60716  ORF Transcript_19313/g.60716 Transcript_19313/m.60716 type:complete len:221 (+) Transcript_19313:478-1140(+)
MGEAPWTSSVLGSRLLCSMSSASLAAREGPASSAAASSSAAAAPRPAEGATAPEDRGSLAAKRCSQAWRRFSVSACESENFSWSWSTRAAVFSWSSSFLVNFALKSSATLWTAAFSLLSCATCWERFLFSASSFSRETEEETIVRALTKWRSAEVFEASPAASPPLSCAIWFARSCFAASQSSSSSVFLLSQASKRSWKVWLFLIIFFWMSLTSWETIIR